MHKLDLELAAYTLASIPNSHLTSTTAIVSSLQL